MRNLGLVLVLVGCAHNVPQDAKTGEDGRQKGAVPVALQEGEGKAHGIVTYPGGDRVDWKKIQIPDGEKGKLDLQLTWKTPRPGLHVAFDVFDQWNTPVVAAAKHKKQGRMQSATIDVAKGTYFVRIYAPKRGDAGEYKLVAHFDKIEAPPSGPIDVPDPPKLPAVPTPAATCDVFDTKNDACRAVCDDMAPAGWPGCKDKEKADAEKAAREAAAKECEERMKNAPKPMDKRIINVAVNGDEAQVTIGVGSEGTQLDNTWSAQVVSSDTGKPIAGGIVTIVRVGKTQTMAKVKLTTDALNKNPTVRLTPPPQPGCSVR